MSISILKTSIRFPPAVGGAEFYLENIADKLSQNEFKLKVITTDLKQHIDNFKFTKNDLINFKKDYPVLRCKSFHIPRTTYHISLPLLNNLFKSDEDIFHSYCIHYFPALAAKLVSQIKKKPFFCTPIFDLNNAVKNKSVFQFYARYILNANGTIFISKFEQQALEQFMNCKIKNSIIIPPSIDSNFVPPDFSENIKNPFSYLHNFKHRLLFVGRLSYGKGLDILVKAAKILHDKIGDFVLIICGKDFGYYDKLKKILKDSGLENVYIYPEISREEINYLYSISDVYILPSRYEAFGIVITEAMAYKTPVIGMNNTAIPYLIKDNETGLLFENENYWDLADKIIKLLNSKNLQDKLIENAYNMIMKDYTWKKNIPKLIDFYKTYM